MRQYTSSGSPCCFWSSSASSFPCGKETGSWPPGDSISKEAEEVYRSHLSPKKTSLTFKFTFQPAGYKEKERPRIAWVCIQALPLASFHSPPLSWESNFPGVCRVSFSWTDSYPDPWSAAYHPCSAVTHAQLLQTLRNFNQISNFLLNP